MVVSQIAELGADTGLVRFVAAAEATGHGGRVPSLVRSAVRPVIVTGVLLVAAVAVTVLIEPGLVAGLPAWLVVVGAALCSTGSLLALLLAVLRGYHDAVSYPLLQNVTLPILRLLGVGAALLLGADAAGVAGGWMIAVLPVTIIAALLARRAVRRHVSGAVRESADAEEFWRFSAARGVSSAVEVMLEWADVIIVGALTSVESAGIYAVVTRCARIGEVVQQAARVVIAPPVSAALARGERHVASEIYGVVTAAMIWLAWPFYLVGIVFADTVLSLFGEGFAEGATALRILLIAMAVSTAAGAVQSILLMGGRSTWQLYDKAGALAVNVVLNLLLVPLWGIEGAAVAWAATLVLDTVVVVVQVQHLMRIRPAGRALAWACAVAVLVAGASALAGRLLIGSSLGALLATVGVAATVYLGVSALLRDRLGAQRLLSLR